MQLFSSLQTCNQS